MVLKVGEGDDAEIGEQFLVSGIEPVLLLGCRRIREQHLLTAGKGDGDPEDGFPMQAARNQFPAAVDRDGACNVAEIAGKGDAT